MKKVISFMLCLVIAFVATISTVAQVTIDEAPDALKSKFKTVQLNCDMNKVVATATSDDGTSAVIGYDKNEKISLWMIKGVYVTKSTADILALAERNLDYPKNDYISTDEVYVSDVYYFDGAFYIICCIEYHCTCDDYDIDDPVFEGSHDYAVATVLLRTVDGKDFTAIKMPSIADTIYNTERGVNIDKFDGKLIFAANSAAFTQIDESDSGVSYYYTSEDSINWTRHESIKVESKSLYGYDLDYYSWKYQGISDDGTAVFRLFVDLSALVAAGYGKPYGYYCTSDFTTYQKLPDSVFGDEYWVNDQCCVNSFLPASGDRSAVLFQTLKIDHGFFVEVKGLNVFMADDVAGNWVQKVDYDGSGRYYRYFRSINDEYCLMLDTGTDVNVYKWNGTNGEVSVDTTNINPKDFVYTTGYNYNGNYIWYMIYKNNSLAVSNNMLDSTVKFDLPMAFKQFIIIGDIGILVGEKVYAIDMNRFSALVMGEELPEITYGDADGDGSITLSDVTLLLQQIAGWNVAIVGNADANDDDNIDLSDVTLLLQHIAGWDVVLGK